MRRREAPRRFRHGDVVEHHLYGVGVVKVVRDRGTVWAKFSRVPGRFVSVNEFTLVSRPGLRPNDEGRTWPRPPVGVHKPYRERTSFAGTGKP
jgi:hypothetical protein